MIGRAAGLIDAETSKELENEAREISKMLYGLMKYYNEIQEKLVPSKNLVY